MKSSKLFQTTQITAVLCLISLGASAQLPADPAPSVKGRWGVNAGVTFDKYKVDPAFRLGMKPGVLPMLTYTYGKNQFEFGPQFRLTRLNNPIKYWGVTFNYKRYFNGFESRFVPYFYSGISFTTSRFDGYPMDNGVLFQTGSEYKMTGVNLSVGYGLEWQLGKHVYLGSSVGLNPGFYVVNRGVFNGISPEGSYTFRREKFSGVGLGFNVNAQIGYRFGGRKK